MGVTTKKKIIPIIIGDTIDPNMIPNLNQSLFSGVNAFEFNIPKIKETNEVSKDQILIFSSFTIG